MTGITCNRYILAAYWGRWSLVIYWTLDYLGWLRASHWPRTRKGNMPVKNFTFGPASMSLWRRGRMICRSSWRYPW